MSNRDSRWRGIKRAAGGASDPIADAPAAYEVAAEVERPKAEATGSPWAEPVDLGVSIDPGAPLPHLIADGQRAVLVFHAGLPANPGWDGTTITVVDPADSSIRLLSWLVLNGVAHVSLGAPNDEALVGHPLYDSGLRHYRAHEVHNSDLIASMERRNRVHPHHRPESFATLRHLIITFHDETFDCVCRSWTTGTVDASFEDALAEAVSAVRTGEFHDIAQHPQ
jgi:hypothetical protein